MSDARPRAERRNGRPPADRAAAPAEHPFPGTPADAEALAAALWDSPSPIAIIGRGTSTMLAANAAMHRLLGCAPGELVGQSTDGMGISYDPQDRDRLIAAYESNHILRDAPLTVRTRAGEPRDLVVAFSELTFQGRPATLVQAIDVTDRRALEDARERERERLVAVLAGLPVGVVVQLESGEISLANDAAAEILGLTMDQLAGRTSFDPRWRAVRPDGSPFPGEEHPAMVTLRTGEPVDGTVFGVHRPDGSLVWIAVSSRPLEHAGPEGQPGVVAAFIDVTALEQARAELIEAKELAEAADRAKSNFLSVVSHELRTPLTAVMGYSQMLLAGADGPLSELQREDVEQISRGADRLLALINDLLDLGRIQGGRLEMEMEPVDLSALLRRLEPDFRVTAANQRIAFDAEVEPGLVVAGDPLRLEQVFLNLVGNAAKFTPEGSIRIEGRRDGDTVEISVADTGIGIPPEDRHRIFEMFHQADSTSTRRHGGMGLGLAISSRIVERLGGTIAVESEVGKGSTFTVRLPGGDGVMGL